MTTGASIAFTDDLGAAFLTNGMPGALGRFANWTPMQRPVGDSVNRMSDSALQMFRTGTQYGAMFELRNIPMRDLASVNGLNVLASPSDFTNAAWSKANITVTANFAPAPDGTTTATKLAITASTTNTSISQAVAVTAKQLAFSVIVKGGTGGSVGGRFALADNTTSTTLVGGTLNFDTGVWAYIEGSTGVTVEPLGNGWYRLTLRAAAITSGHTFAGFIGWAGTTGVTAGQFLLITTGGLFPGQRRVDLAARLVSYLLTGGTVAVTTGDIDGNSYATCGLAPNASPALSQSDPGLLEYTLSLALINLAGSPAAMVCHYV